MNPFIQSSSMRALFLALSDGSVVTTGGMLHEVQQTKKEQVIPLGTCLSRIFPIAVGLVFSAERNSNNGAICAKASAIISDKESDGVPRRHISKCMIHSEGNEDASCANTLECSARNARGNERDYRLAMPIRRLAFPAGASLFSSRIARHSPPVSPMHFGAWTLE